MTQFMFTVYDPPEKGMPFLAVRIEGVKTKYKKVTAIATKTRAQAETAAKDLEKDLMDPYWRERDSLRARYAPTQQKD